MTQGQGHRPIRVLNVAEKPSVARALAGVFSLLPGSRDQPMQRTAAQIFTHSNVCFPAISSQGHGIIMNNAPLVGHDMITTSVRGHLASNDFPNNFGWSNCNPIALFEAPIETYYSDDMQPLANMLTDLAKQVQTVILWLDCDREGEAIAAEVTEVCLESNRRLQIYRARFSTVLPNEIQRALKSLGRLNEAFVAAVQARSELDLRVGAAFTRFQTLRIQKKFDITGVISYGPCQFPTLGFVVERWARIETFVPEDFWFLELKLSVPNDQQQQAQNNNAQRPNQQQRSIHFTWKRNRLYDRVQTMALFESCLEAGEAVVTELSGRPKNKWRPVPLATVEMQKRASRFLRMGAEHVMKVAEELYQQGFISYPRTETERFRPEFQHQPLIQEFAGIAGDFGNYANKLLNENYFQRPRNGQSDDNAHPPITPCKAVDPESIGNIEQRRLYSLITKHYLACVSQDAVGKETTLVVKMGSEEFTAKGLMIVERNWLEIYAPHERWSTGQGELPHLEIGSRIRPSSFLMKDGRTTAPLPISEVELITLMDGNGIGTDATIAQHIQTIQSREYAQKDGNQRFNPTKLGIALVEGYNSMGYQLNKPDLRRETEAECNLVAAGQKTKEAIMGPILAKMKECFQRANAEAHKLDEAIARHFSRLGVNNANLDVVQARFSECGVCRNLMALKQTRVTNNENQSRKKLLFCATCQLGLVLPRGTMSPVTENDNGGGPPTKCPICQYQVVRVSHGEGYTGNGYTYCPKCFSDPPLDHGGVAGADSFRCFNCQHPTCRLASGTPGGKVEVIPCPFCHQRSGGKVMLKKNSRGFVLSCNQYSGQARCAYTIWLPKEASTITVPEGDQNVCQQCSNGGRVVRNLHFVWKSGSVPPHLGRDCTACVLCDTDFREDMNIRLPQPGQVLSNQRRSQNNGGSRGGSGRGRGRGSGRGRGRGAWNNQGGAGGGNACFRCGQPGHYANNCPNQ